MAPRIITYRRRHDSPAPEALAEIVRRFEAGESSTVLGNEFGFSPSAVWKWARDAGVADRGRPGIKLSGPRRDEMMADFARGDHIDTITAKYGVNFSFVYAQAKKRGITHRRRDKYTYREGAFKDGSPEAAYWIGFLMADGWISGTRLGVMLGAVDTAHLEKLRAFLCCGHPVLVKPPRPGTKFKGGASCKPYFVAPSLVTDLAEFGVTERKSHTARVRHLENSRDFWRGLVDGDGSVGWTKPSMRPRAYARLSLGGSLPIVTQFRAFITAAIGGPTPNIRQAPGMHTLALAGEQAAAAASVLYGGATVFLDRKMSNAQDIIRLHQYGSK